MFVKAKRGRCIKPARTRSFSFPMTSGLVMLGAFLLMTGCGSKEEAAAGESPALEIEPTQVVGIGRIEPELKILEMASQTTGVVTRIHVQAGGTVVRGDTLLELDSGVEKARIEQARARIQTQASQIESTRAALAAKKIRRENARVFFERIQTLYEQDAETKYSFDLAKTDYEALIEETRQLEADTMSAERLREQYKADLRLAQSEYEKKSLKAPAHGQVLSWDIAVGSLVTPQKSVGTFAPESPLTAWCEVDELFATKVRTGLKAYVRQQGTTEPLARGEVTFVGPSLRKKSIFSDEVGDLRDRRTREVRITLGPGADLLLGSRIECVILLEKP